MRVCDPTEERVCGLSTAADHVRVAASHGGAVRSHNHAQGISHKIVDVAPVEAMKSAREEEMEAQELGRFAWFWSFAWRQDS